MSKVIVDLARRQVFAAVDATADDVRAALWQVMDRGHQFAKLVLLKKRRLRTNRPEFQEIADKARSWTKSVVLSKVVARHRSKEQAVLEELKSQACPTQEEEESNRKRKVGNVVLRMGRHKGKELRGVPVDYLAGLLKFGGLWDSTRKDIENWLAYLEANPDEARLPFRSGYWVRNGRGKYIKKHNKMAGRRLGELSNNQIRYLMEDFDWFDEDSFLVRLIHREYERRLRWNHEADTWELPGVTDREPFESKGFCPSEGRMGGGKKPSLWTQRCPTAAADNEDVNQKLGLPVMNVLHQRSDTWRVLRGPLALLRGTQGDDEETVIEKRHQRSDIWNWVDLTSFLDEIERAPNEEELEEIGHQIAAYLKTNGAAKGVREWLREAYIARREVIHAKEESLNLNARGECAIKSGAHKRRLQQATPKPELPIA